MAWPLNRFNRVNILVKFMESTCFIILLCPFVTDARLAFAATETIDWLAMNMTQYSSFIHECSCRRSRLLLSFSLPRIFFPLVMKYLFSFSPWASDVRMTWRSFSIRKPWCFYNEDCPSDEKTIFLDTTSHLYNKVYPFADPSIRPSVTSSRTSGAILMMRLLSAAIDLFAVLP